MYKCYTLVLLAVAVLEVFLVLLVLFVPEPHAPKIRLLIKTNPNIDNFFIFTFPPIV